LIHQSIVFPMNLNRNSATVIQTNIFRKTLIGRVFQKEVQINSEDHSKKVLICKKWRKTKSWKSLMRKFNLKIVKSRNHQIKQTPSLKMSTWGKENKAAKDSETKNWINTWSSWELLNKSKSKEPPLQWVNAIWKKIPLGPITRDTKCS
jgi:hypothetical protein